MRLFLFSLLWFSFVASATTKINDKAVIDQEQTNAMSEEHKQWLKEQFAEKHQALLPKVAVADIFFGCNVERKIDPVPYKVADIIVKMNKKFLAEQLKTCLSGDSLESDNAINFGLIGCFTDQLSSLPKDKRSAQMVKVQSALSSLSKEERQKSFTKCVTEQAIGYIK